MRRIRLVITVLLICLGMYCLPNFGISQEYLEKDGYRLIRSNYTGPLIDGMNVYKWKETQNFAGFSIRPINGMKYMAKMYQMYNPLTKQTIGLEIGLYPTVSEAEERVLYLLNMHDNTPMDEWENPPIGDSAWHHTMAGNRPPELTTGITFIRRNVVVFLYTMDSEINILSLAKSIDSAFLNGAPYVSIHGAIQPPVIHSVTLSKKAVTAQDKVSMTISAEDPLGLKLLYSTDAYPFIHENSMIDFYYNPNPDPNKYTDNMFAGEHQIMVWVVNENNLFSSITNIPIFFNSLRGER